jgi:fluoroacetyl-CoA thioesterase
LRLSEAKGIDIIMEIGIKGSLEITVSEDNSAKTMGSGALDVLATPAMIALMEKTAWTSVQPQLEDGQGTVGISMNITHDAPTPLGMKVRCETELTAIDGRKLTFKVEAFDEKGCIGKGVHERFIIDSEKFQAKANKKLD